MKKYFLKTERIGFSEWNDKDLNDAIGLWGDPEVTKFISANGKMSKEQITERLTKEIDNYKNFKVQYWPIYLIKNDKNIGCCGLRPYDFEKNIFELGFHLKKDYWGKGLAQEASLAVIEYAFNVLKVDALFAGHNPNNTASSKLLKKLGFKYTHDEFYPPTRLNHPSYIMTKEDFKYKYI